MTKRAAYLETVLLAAVVGFIVLIVVGVIGPAETPPASVATKTP